LQNERLFVGRFGWIPSALINTLYTDDKDIKASLETHFYQLFAPMDKVDALDIMLAIVSHLDDRARTALYSLLKEKQQHECSGCVTRVDRWKCSPS
jgi:hypothetical protein